jgi:hypothetical protein
MNHSKPKGLASMLAEDFLYPMTQISRAWPFIRLMRPAIIQKAFYAIALGKNKPEEGYLVRYSLVDLGSVPFCHDAIY